jgi:hypothetical protein
MHLSFEDILDRDGSTFYFRGKISRKFKSDIDDIDAMIFYSQPTSFFVVDKRIHHDLRELITEADGCLKMNYLTGASACIRKAIYQLCVLQNAKGEDYETRIKSLKEKYPLLNTMLFDILASIQEMTSDKVHEESWVKWDSPRLKLMIETLKAVLYEIYVLPEEKKQSAAAIQKLEQEWKVSREGKGKKD